MNQREEKVKKNKYFWTKKNLSRNFIYLCSISNISILDVLGRNKSAKGWEIIVIVFGDFFCIDIHGFFPFISKDHIIIPASLLLLDGIIDIFEKFILLLKFFESFLLLPALLLEELLFSKFFLLCLLLFESPSILLLLLLEGLLVLEVGLGFFGTGGRIYFSSGVDIEPGFRLIWFLLIGVAFASVSVGLLLILIALALVILRKFFLPVGILLLLFFTSFGFTLGLGVRFRPLRVAILFRLGVDIEEYFVLVIFFLAFLLGFFTA